MVRWWSNRRVIVRAKREVAVATDKYENYKRRCGLRAEYFAHHTHDWTIEFYRWSGWNRSTQLIRSDNQFEFYFLCVRRPVGQWMERDRRQDIHLIEPIRIEFSFVINLPTGNFSLTSFASILCECAAWKRFISSMEILLPSNPSKKKKREANISLCARAIAIANCHAFAQFLAMLHCCDLNS